MHLRLEKYLCSKFLTKFLLGDRLDFGSGIKIIYVFCGWSLLDFLGKFLYLFLYLYCLLIFCTAAAMWRNSSDEFAALGKESRTLIRLSSTGFGAVKDPHSTLPCLSFFASLVIYLFLLYESSEAVTKMKGNLLFPSSFSKWTIVYELFELRAITRTWITWPFSIFHWKSSLLYLFSTLLSQNLSSLILLSIFLLLLFFRQ